MKYEYRIILQSDKTKDGFFALLIHRKLARIFAFIFLNHLHVNNPNVITFIGLLICFSFPLVIFTGYSITAKLIILSLLHFLRFTLDCVDGIVARITKKCSDFGRKFEGFVDGRAEDFYFLSIYLIFTNPIVLVLWVTRKIDKFYFLYRVKYSIYKLIFDSIFQKVNRNVTFAPDTPDLENILFLAFSIFAMVANLPSLFLHLFVFYYLISFSGNVTVVIFSRLFRKR